MKKVLNLLLTFIFLLTLFSCASGKIARVEKDIPAGSVKKSSTFYIAPISADNANYEGDKTNDLEVIANSKTKIKSTFQNKVKDRFIRVGFKTKSKKQADYIISAAVTNVDHGSSAKRLMFGMGAGASQMNVKVKTYSKTRELIASFDVVATSGGRGGFNALGSFLEAHIADASEKIVEFFKKRTVKE